MSDFGPMRRETGVSEKAPRGRPKKKPDYDREKEIQSLIQQAVALFEEPFDDRKERSQDLPSISTVAEKMKTSRMRVRKMLITANYYSSVNTRKALALLEQGKTISEISTIMKIRYSAVNSLLPYRKGTYHLQELPVNAERGKRFRDRKTARENLIKHADAPDCSDWLWAAIQAFENFPFRLEKKSFHYSVNENEISCEGKKISRQEIEKAFCEARRSLNHQTDENRDSSLLSKELHTIFLRIGACDSLKI